MSKHLEARSIDRQEFKAECLAVRERVTHQVAARIAERRTAVERWLGRDGPEAAFNPWTSHTKTVRRRAAKLVPKVRKRRPAIMLDYQGETRSIKEWSALLDIRAGTIHNRIAYGWPIDRVLGEKVGSCMGRPWPIAVNQNTIIPNVAISNVEDATPGVALDLQPLRGTGGRGTLQEITNITFSDEAIS